MQLVPLTPRARYGGHSETGRGGGGRGGAAAGEADEEGVKWMRKENKQVEQILRGCDFLEAESL
jgi:hypothetical protein